MTHTLQPGTRVQCSYRLEHVGTVLAHDDPRVWQGSMAFSESVGLPDAAAVTAHVARCRAQGLFRDGAQPVLWDFGPIYWDRHLIPVAQCA